MPEFLTKRMFQQLDKQEKKIDKLLVVTTKMEEHMKEQNGRLKAHDEDINIMKENSWERKGMTKLVGIVAGMAIFITTIISFSLKLTGLV